MSRPRFGYSWDDLSCCAEDITASSEHPQFPAVNVSQRWRNRQWRSRYGEDSGLGSFEITANNGTIYFDEGAGSISAVAAVGTYDAVTLAAELSGKMTAAGGQTYEVSFDELLGRFSISAAAVFDLLTTTALSAIWDVLGYDTSADATGLDDYLSDYIRIHTRERLFIDLGESLLPDFLAVCGHNFSAAAEVRLVIYGDAWITETEAFSLTVQAGNMLTYFTASSAFRYAALEIIDPENPYLYVAVGRLFLGNLTELHYAFTPRRTARLDDLSTTMTSATGQVSSVQKGRQLVSDYNFDAVAPADLAGVEALLEAVGNSRAFFLIEDMGAGNLSNVGRYCSIISASRPHLISDWRTGAHYWRLALQIRDEV